MNINVKLVNKTWQIIIAPHHQAIDNKIRIKMEFRWNFHGIFIANRKLEKSERQKPKGNLKKKF